MSTGPRIPLAIAHRAAGGLVDLWKLTPESYTVVGSIRRGLATVGDIELVVVEPTIPGEAPTNMFGEKVGARSEDRDPLCERIEASLKGRDGWSAIKGLKPAFKYTQLEIRLAPKTDDAKAILGGQPIPIKVEIHRPEPERRGWIELIRTWSADFSQAMLAFWKRSQCIPTEQPGSKDGALVDKHGQAQLTPREIDVFNRLRCLYVEPSKRTGWEAILPVDLVTTYDRREQAKLAKAMKHLGISHLTQIEQLFERQCAA